MSRQCLKHTKYGGKRSIDPRLVIFHGFDIQWPGRVGAWTDWEPVEIRDQRGTSDFAGAPGSVGTMRGVSSYTHVLGMTEQTLT